MSKREYIIANRKWLEDKAKEEGVEALPKGIYYKGTIDGKKFDTSIGGTPIAMRLSDLIDGWIIALQQMHVGDQWELYIPAEMGYGKYSQPGIPGGSTLIFDFELIGVA